MTVLNGRASAGWIILAMCDDVDENGQLTKRRKILMGSTMRAGGGLDANTAFRVEALGCLIVPIIVCLANEFIHQQRRLGVRHACDNQGLVDQLCWMYKTKETSYNSRHSGQRFGSTDSPLGEEERQQIDLATRARRATRKRSKQMDKR